MSKAPKSLVRLLNLLSAMREIAPFSALTADEEQLLDELIIRWHQASAVSVSEVMYEVSRATSSTTYRRLVALRDKGLVAFRKDPQDKRLRFVEPTVEAQKYMTALGDGLSALINGAS